MYGVHEYNTRPSAAIDINRYDYLDPCIHTLEHTSHIVKFTYR